MPNGERVLTRNESMAYHTSLAVGGPAAFWYRPIVNELLPIFALADRANLPVLVIGRGTNLLVSDTGYPGIVVQLSDISSPTFYPWNLEENVTTVEASAGAQYSWDRFVEQSVERDLQGIECLSGIPGTVGAAPMQNIGAYGQQLSDTLTHVDVLDRADGKSKRLTAAQCGFGYRTSIFKGTEAGRYIIWGVSLRLHRSKPGWRGYHQVAAAVAENATVAAVREAVIALRGPKGMLLDWTRQRGNNWSAGSFFKNPVVATTDYPEQASAVFLPDGRVKLSAAWLIESSGLPRGYVRGSAGLSQEHALSIVNLGGYGLVPSATAGDIVALAREVQEKVAGRFGILLEPEVQLVGFDEYPLLKR